MISGINSCSSNIMSTYQSSSARQENLPVHNQLQETVKPNVALAASTKIVDAKGERNTTVHDIEELISMIKISKQIIESEFTKPVVPPMVQEHALPNVMPVINHENRILSNIVNNPGTVDENNDGFISQKEVQDVISEEILSHPKPSMHPIS